MLRPVGLEVREIATRLGRLPSTISRELRRTPPRVAATPSTGPRPPSGTLIGEPNDRRSRNSPPMMRCEPMCRIGLPAGFRLRTARSCRDLRCAGSGAGPGAGRIDAGPRPGARSRSPTDSASTTPMMRRCESRTKPSTRPSTSKAAAPCAVSWWRACAPAGRCEFPVPAAGAAARRSWPLRS